MHSDFNLPFPWDWSMSRKCLCHPHRPIKAPPTYPQSLWNANMLHFPWTGFHSFSLWFLQHPWVPPVLLGTGKEFSKSSTSNRKPEQHNTAVLAALGEAQEGKGPPNPSRQTGRHTLRLVLAALGKQMVSQSQCLLRRFRFCRGLEHSYNHTGFLFYRYLYLFFHFHRKQVFLQVKSVIKNK